MSPKHLPAVYYPLAVIGRQCLASLALTRSHYSAGLTRSGFIFAQMESAASLPSAVMAIQKLPTRRSAARWRRNLAATPGFCYLKLIQYEWVVPALCTLSAYPSASDVAILEPYFRADRPSESWAVVPTSRRRGHPVFHVVGVDVASRASVYDRLRSIKLGLIGANPFGPPTNLGPLRGPPPISGPSHTDLPYAQPAPFDYRMPPMPPMCPPLSFPVPPPHLLTRPPAPSVRLPQSRPRDQGRYFDRSSNDFGVRSNLPKKKAPASTLFQLYNTDPSRRRQGSPSAIAQTWQSAARDKLDEALASLKSQVPLLPVHAREPFWNGFLSWFQNLKKSPDFIRSSSVPIIKEHFASIFDPALASAQADASFLASLEARGMELSSTSALVNKLAADLANPPPGVSVDVISTKLTEARERLAELDDEVDRMEADAIPPSVVDDPVAANDDFIPIPAPSWPEENFEDYEGRTAKFIPVITGKLSLESLLVVMDVRSDSKVLLPRPLELYSEEEINSARPKGSPPWFNRHEDPLEPAKCWPLATFSRVYSKPGFHFFIARTAQIGPMYKDQKLPSLRSKLSARWDCPVEFEAMAPRQDWMLCTIPDVSGPRAEILTTSLMRLSEGNASYVVRHLSALSCVHDLIVTIRGANTDANGVYAQLRKRLLEFELGGVHLGWRVLGVRRTDTPSQYRASFILDSPSVFWPWSFSFDHAHGSINPSSPLLNFDPPWLARKPYACQACYSSVHATGECPLPRICLGGISIVGHSSLLAVKSKKPGERLIIIDRSLIPKKIPDAPSADAPPDATVASTALPDGAPSAYPSASLPAIPKEVPSEISPPEALYRFLSSKFAALGFHPVPSDAIRLASASGEIGPALLHLGLLAPTTWTYGAILDDFIAWQDENIPPGSAHGWSAMSDVQSESLDAPPTAASPPSGAFVPIVPADQAPITLSEPRGPSGKAPAPAHSHTPTPPSSSGLGSPIPADWAKKGASNRPPSKNELAAAVSAIIHGPVPFGNFVAPPPGPDATPADVANAMVAIGAALDVPSPYASIEPPAPTTRSPGATSHPSVALPCVSPPWVSPLPADDASQPSVIDLSQSSAPDEPSLSHGLTVLRSVYPSACEEFLLAALEKHEYNTAAALGWLVSIQEVDSITAVMSEAFPGAPKKTISRLVQDSGGDMSLVWSTLSQSYDTSWTNQYSSSVLQRATSRGSILVRDDDSDVSEVLAASPALVSFEREWWSSLLVSRRFCLGNDSPHSSSWDPVCSIACTSFPISPHFVGYVTALGRRLRDLSAFKEAVTFIRSMPQFMTISAPLSSIRQSAFPIVKILLEDGLTNPSAALWLALNDLEDNASLFTGFTRAHKYICRSRNKALHAAQLVPRESATTADAIVLDSDDASEMDTEIVPVPPTCLGGKLPSG